VRRPFTFRDCRVSYPRFQVAGSSRREHPRSTDAFKYANEWKALIDRVFLQIQHEDRNIREHPTQVAIEL
jgi:hypothetical protein